jgi:hypothetical protein
MAKKQKSTKAYQPRAKQPSGYQPRGSKGSSREKLARASGFRSDAEIAKLFPPGLHKLVRLLQQVMAELVKDQSQKELSESPVSVHYAGLIRALADPETNGTEAPAVSQDADEPAEHRAQKRSALAADALRQVVLEAAETPLAMLPSLLADRSLDDHEKIKRLQVYTRSLEMLYEPLQLEPIGDPGQDAVFDSRFHESAKDILEGQPCVITRIGFTKGEAVIRKAVVSEIQE